VDDERAAPESTGADDQLSRSSPIQPPGRQPLGSAKTVIGGSRQADLTIAGAPGVREQHATVLYDPKTRSYTIVGEVTVNNRPVKTRRLEAGDVIDVGGATIVFDDGEV